jgi:multidrug efflux pump subunit AcrA (membrane-fusion protein)
MLGKYFASVVGADNKVEQRPIQPGTRIGELWVVESGLKAGDTIIVEGLQKARPGSAVTPAPISLDGQPKA